MIRADQIPDDAWTELALRLESCGVHVTEQQARLAAVALIEAWPGLWVGPMDYDEPDAAILPLPQKEGDA